jgi:hypothetical protein
MDRAGTLARTAEDKPSELIRHSLVRARFCESVARLAAEWAWSNPRFSPACSRCWML